jgi:hypothetical protein
MRRESETIQATTWIGGATAAFVAACFAKRFFAWTSPCFASFAVWAGVSAASANADWAALLSRTVSLGTSLLGATGADLGVPFDGGAWMGLEP